MSNLAIPGRWLRHKLDGTIYSYNANLAPNPAVEEVSEEVAFPEKFLPAKQKGRKSKIDMSVGDDVKPSKGKKIKVAVRADALRGLPK